MGMREWLLSEAKAKAIYIRSQDVTPAAVMVVDVLNMLHDALGFEHVDTTEVWSGP